MNLLLPWNHFQSCEGSEVPFREWRRITYFYGDVEPESRKQLNLPPAVTPLFITFLIIQHRCEASHIVPTFSHAKSPDLHASEFSSSKILL